MEGRIYEDFFVHPQDATHRRYEALRAVFVEGELCVDVAHRMNIPHGTLRNWACEFRKQIDAGEAAPFFFQPRRVGRPAGAH
jgi:hypothetical protein